MKNNIQAIIYHYTVYLLFHMYIVQEVTLIIGTHHCSIKLNNNQSIKY